MFISQVMEVRYPLRYLCNGLLYGVFIIPAVSQRKYVAIKTIVPFRRNGRETIMAYLLVRSQEIWQTIICNDRDVECVHV